MPLRSTTLLASRTLMSSSAPVNLVSVNTAPDRARLVIGTVIENVKDRYSIVHAGNSTSQSARPHLLGFEASVGPNPC